MNPILIVILLIVATAAIAFALYKLGFSIDKLKLKLGILEAEASRENPAASKQTVQPAGPKIDQQASDGGTISKSGITAPADSPAEIKQKAAGEKSKIDGSPIKLD